MVIGGKRWKLLVVLGMAAAVAVGAWIGWSWYTEYKQRQFAEKWERVKIGFTTTKEVEALLGKPDYVGQSGGHGGCYWFYGSTRHVGLNFMPRFPFVDVWTWKTWDCNILFRGGDSEGNEEVTEKSEIKRDSIH